VRAEAGAWLAGQAGRPASDGGPLAASDRPDGGRFDRVFVDAPDKLADLVARQLDTHLPGVLAPGGRAVVESGARRPLAIASLERLRQRRYGAADISIYALEDE
jgi:16S rRNA G966 N2-methylase RsmD